MKKRSYQKWNEQDKCKPIPIPIPILLVILLSKPLNKLPCPKPRGIQLEEYELVKAMSGFTPSGWSFDQNDWWLEENGLIMEKPDFPIPDGSYIVTGGRETQSILR